MLQPVPAAFDQILVVVVAPTQDDAVPPPHVGLVKLLAFLHILLAFGLVHQFLLCCVMAKSEEAASSQLLDGLEDLGHRLNPKGLEVPVNTTYIT